MCTKYLGRYIVLYIVVMMALGSRLLYRSLTPTKERQQRMTRSKTSNLPLTDRH